MSSENMLPNLSVDMVCVSVTQELLVITCRAGAHDQCGFKVEWL